MTVEGFIMEEVSHDIKDRTVPDLKAHLDGLVSYGLYQMTLARSGRSQEQDITILMYEPAACKIIYLLFLDRCIEREVKVIDCPQFPEAAGFDTTLYLSLISDKKFIL
jgi:hypothetical protein